MNKTYYLLTYGCQMNYSDSERIASFFENLKFKPAPEAEADILIFNLCSVRQHAIDRIWGLLNKINKSKRKDGQEQKIILTGCIILADKNKFLERGILILDIKELNEWSKQISKFINYKLPIWSTGRKNSNRNLFKFKDYFSVVPKYFSKFTAYVPIMTGCNNFCSYCVVPYTRGREYSRPAEEIISEVKDLILQGFKEIILLGQNVNSYNYLKNNKKIDFVNLLKMVDETPGVYWLSFLTSHPKDLSKELINCFQECNHLIPYLHLPLQSGSNKILKAMNRNYSREHYLELIKLVKKTAKDINISTDLIVGFSGETKSDFNQTVKAMKEIKYDMAYLAVYSPRPGTAAFKLKDNISSTEKEKRKNVLNDILKKTALENNKKMLGLIVEVLVDKVKNGVAFGKTRNFKRIKITTKKKGIDKKMIGSFVSAKIIKANIWNLEGEIV